MCPLRFTAFCDYLEALEKITCNDPPFLPQERRTKLFHANVTWFASHRKIIDGLDDKSSSALLSTFLPHKRKDRIYGLQTPSLLKLLGRCLGLSATARRDLASYRIPGNGDLGECLQRLLRAGGPPAIPPVTVQEIDDMLNCLAGQNRFSAPSIQQSFRSSERTDVVLKSIVLRLQPAEAKWLVRLILKDLSPVSLDDDLVLRSFHFLLPDLLGMQDSLDVACAALKDTFSAYPSQPDPRSRDILRQTAASSLKPLPWVKVSRPEFCKARSIKNCLQMTAGRKWLVERKYDGEYCQIHIDLSKGDDWLKVYSKSGRDSTADRVGLRDIIEKCLRIGTDRCQFQRHCILVGEMVVFNDVRNCIVAFDGIRKHVSRAGVFVGAKTDSPTEYGEHLMIVFFDLLLLDDEPVLSLSVEKRKERLSKIYKKIHGRATPAESRVMDFSEPHVERKLMSHFAASIASRHEGLVLKPCGVPYLPPSFDERGKHLRNCIAGIKLKKDYLSGLGDEADFAVLGASYSAQEAKKQPSMHLRFTRFHLGCLVNKDEMQRTGVKPRFKLVATIAYDQCMSTDILERVNGEGDFLAEPHPSSIFHLEPDQAFCMEVCFREPFVFEVLGSSFSKLPGGFYMLRHPRVRKLHRDRTWRDCISFDELQNAASEALGAPRDSETQENLNWIAKLETDHRKRIARRGLNTTPRSGVPSTTPLSTRSGFDAPPVPKNILEPKVRAPLDKRGSRQSISACTAGFGSENAPLPTPPESSPLSERTLTKPKRSCKRRLDGNDHASSKRSCRDIVSSPLAVQDWKTQSVGKASRSLRRAPLADITQHESPKAETSAKNGAHGTPKDSHQCGCKHRRATPPDGQNVCFLSLSVVYLYGLTDVERERVRCKVVNHGAVVIEDLQYWERDSGVYDVHAATVGESQAYVGLHRVVLVDVEQREQLRCCITRLEEVKLRGLVKILDYRMVDALCRANAGLRKDQEGENR